MLPCFNQRFPSRYSCLFRFISSLIFIIGTISPFALLVTTASILAHSAGGSAPLLKPRHSRAHLCLLLGAALLQSLGLPWEAGTAPVQPWSVAKPRCCFSDLLPTHRFSHWLSPTLFPCPSTQAGQNQTRQLLQHGLCIWSRTIGKGSELGCLMSFTTPCAPDSPLYGVTLLWLMWQCHGKEHQVPSSGHDAAHQQFLPHHLSLTLLKKVISLLWHDVDKSLMTVTYLGVIFQALTH